MENSTGGPRGIYFNEGDFAYGAVAGDQNYANISFDGLDLVSEAVAQFNFDGMGGGFLVAIAFAEGTTLADGVPLTSANVPQDLSTLTNTGSSTLEISEGVALIHAASVPEPSSLPSPSVPPASPRRQR